MSKFAEIVSLHEVLSQALSEQKLVKHDLVQALIQQALKDSPQIDFFEDRHRLRSILRFWATYLTREGEEMPEINIDAPERRPPSLKVRSSAPTVTQELTETSGAIVVQELSPDRKDVFAMTTELSPDKGGDTFAVTAELPSDIEKVLQEEFGLFPVEIECLIRATIDNAIDALQADPHIDYLQKAKILQSFPLILEATIFDDRREKDQEDNSVMFDVRRELSFGSGTIEDILTYLLADMHIKKLEKLASASQEGKRKGH